MEPFQAYGGINGIPPYAGLKTHLLHKARQPYRRGDETYRGSAGFRPAVFKDAGKDACATGTRQCFFNLPGVAYITTPRERALIALCRDLLRSYNCRPQLVDSIGTVRHFHRTFSLRLQKLNATPTR